MASYKVASRYAKSILDLSKEQGVVEAVAADMETLKGVCANREFTLLLKSPIVTIDKKQAIMKELLGGKINDLTLKFLNLLILKGRESVLPSISDEFINQFKILKKIKRAKLITAVKMDDAEINTIRSSFQSWLAPGETMEITQKVDPEIIGGFILEMEDKQCDSSIRRKMSQIKTGLYDKSYVNLIEKR